jgi:hypothetical protein
MQMTAFFWALPYRASLSRFLGRLSALAFLGQKKDLTGFNNKNFSHLQQ